MIVIGGVVACAAIAGAVFGPAMIEKAMFADARLRGFDCKAAATHVHVGHAELDDVTCTLANVRGVVAHAKHVAIALDRISPKSVTVDGLGIDVTGEAFLGDLVKWYEGHGDSASFPVAAEKATVTWRDGAPNGPRAELRDGTFAAHAYEGSLLGAELRVMDADLGFANVRVRGGRGSMHITAGTDADAALLSVKISNGESQGVAIDLEPVPIEPIASAFGGTAPPGTIEAKVSFPLPDAEKPAPIDATVAMTIKGYVPPHPKELDGILYGASTVVSTKAHIPADRKSVKLTDLHVDAGALKLTGTGSMDAKKVAMNLKGSIPCSSLATSVAKADLGVFGPLAGSIAKRTLTGSVEVVLDVDADTDALEKARIDKSLRLACSAFGL